MVAINSGGGGGGGGSKRQRVDGLDGRCETVGSHAIAVDRISSLPEELRLHMLTRLPLKDAIRTGALARGWRDLWKRRWAHNASRAVHLSSRDDPRRKLDAMEREPRPRRRLERFSLSIGISTLKASELRRFVEYAAECGVEDLHVETRCVTASKLNFHLPLLNRALACLSLRDITVSMFYNGARSTHRPLFHALEVIRFVSVSFRPKAFAKMMALCPSLLTLDMRECECIGWDFVDRLPPNLKSLTIAGSGLTIAGSVWISGNHGLDSVHVPPTLRSFRYSGYSSDLPLSIAHDAALSDLYIQLYHDSARMNEWNIIKLRRSLPTDLSNLNVLTICYTALKGASVLPADGANDQLPNFNLHSLKELHLLMLQTKPVDLANLYVFLRTLQCPNLERLFVEFPYCKCGPMEGSIVWEEPPEDGWDNLVIVKVMNFNWCPFEIQLVSFLLRKARFLRKLLIVTYKLTPVDSPGTPKADLSLFKEALVNGKIMLITYTDDIEETKPYHEAKLF